MSVPIRFGTDGWRAIMAREFTFDNVAIVAQAVACYLKDAGKADRGVFIGYDARLLSDLFTQTIADVLSANGITVYLPPRDTPTPVTMFTIGHMGLGGGIMMTASHNPPAYNGLKFQPDTLHPALPEITDAIEVHIRRIQEQHIAVDRTPRPALQHRIDPLPPYFEHLKTLLDCDVLSTLKAVYDPLHATGRGYVDRFLAETGAQVETIKGDWNPAFGGALPDPNEANTRFLAQRVLETGATIGLSTDGDADRFGIVDSDGTWISPNRVIVLALHYLLERRKPARTAVVRTVATTHQVDARAQAYGGIEVIETPVGFKWVGSNMKAHNALIGGEESGGFSIAGHIPEKDGILADLLIAEMVARTGKSCGTLLQEIEQITGPFVTDRIDIHMDPATKDRLMAQLRSDPPASIAGETVTGTDTRDGVKLRMQDGSWCLIRPSGTEPMIRCYAEAASAERLAAIQSAVENLQSTSS